MTVLDLMESMKEFGKRRVRDWWDSSKVLIQRLQSWRDSASEMLHPCLRIPLLALIDVANWCVFGIGLLALIAVGLFLFCSFMLVMMAPFLVVASWLSSYLLPPVDRSFHPTLVMRHTVFAWASIVLFGVLYMLNNCVKRTNPESNITDFLANYVEGLSTVPCIGVAYALWTIISACCVVFIFDFTLAVGWGFLATSYLLYYFFRFCYLIIHHIPWFVLLPLAAVLPLFVVSFFHRVNYDADQDDDPERRFDPPESTYGTV